MSAEARPVTMLFTDIEDSTLLTQRLGPRWPETIDLHRRLCRASWGRWRGREIDTAGDGFFVVFDDPGDAVSAALDAQRGLQGAGWPGGEVVRVRMGLHTGEATEYDGSYVGYEVHRAARIAGAAHGGQLLCSTAVPLADVREPDLRVADLGRHRLKDLAALETLLQLGTSGLLADFPPPRSAGAPTGAVGTDFPPTTRRLGEVVAGCLRHADGRTTAVTGYGVRIGRTPDNDVQVTDHQASRHHCAITASDGGFVLTDLHSTNGTFVNDARLTGSRLLATGDVVRVGSVTLDFVWPRVLDA